MDLGLAVRVRAEYWDAFSADEDWYTGIRSRVRLQYGFRDAVRVSAELQDVRLDSLGRDPLAPLAAGGGVARRALIRRFARRTPLARFSARAPRRAARGATRRGRA